MALYRVTFRGTLPGETFNFGIHCDGPAGTAATLVTDATTAMTAWWNDATDPLKSHYSNDVSIVAVHAAELDGTTGKQVDASESGVTLTGTSAGDMLPHEVAIAVSTRAAAANRKDRGRFYLPPPAVGEISNGLLLVISRDHIANGATILFNQLQAAGYTPVILHSDLTSSPITAVSVGDVPDVQKRRRNKLVEARIVVGV